LRKILRRAALYATLKALSRAQGARPAPRDRRIHPGFVAGDCLSRSSEKAVNQATHPVVCFDFTDIGEYVVGNHF
jgi:hypothetical protein